MEGIPMVNPSQLEQMAKKIVDIIPEGFAELPESMHSQVKAVLNSGLDKMDLVTREEFDVQTQVLLRTRQKLTEMEAKLAELEAKLADK
mgnify:CR=1 FL=1